MDITPPGTHTLLPLPHHPHLLGAYDPQGKFLGATSTATATHLWHKAPTPTRDFTTQITTAILQSTKPQKSNTSAHPIGNRIPDKLIQTLTQITPNWNECCATALTHHPQCTDFLSLHKDDCTLGALGMWSSQVWTGNWILSPPKDHLLLPKLLRWGLGCAMYGPSQPLLILTLLPKDSHQGAPCTSHPLYHPLATLPANMCKVMKGATTHTDPLKHMHHPHGYTGCTLGAICNPAGWEQLHTIFPTLQTLLNRASSSPISWSHLPEDIIDPSQPNFLIDPRFTHLTPSKLTKLLQTTTTLTPSLPASPRPPTPWDNSPPTFPGLVTSRKKEHDLH